MDEDLVREYLGDILSSRVSDLQILGGNDVNYTARITTENDIFFAKLMVRQPSNKFEHHRFLTVHQIFTKLNNTSLKVPNIVHVDADICTIGEYKIYSTMIMEFLDFEPLDEIWKTFDQSQKNDFARYFAKIMAEIHSISYPGFGKSGFGGTSYQTSWTGYILDLLKNTQLKLATNNHVDKNLVDNTLTILFNNPKLWQYDGRPSLTHQDLWFGNILVAPKNPKSLVLLDWEWSELSDPLMDLLWIDDLFFSDEETIQNFTSSYGIDLDDIDYKLQTYDIIKSLVGAAEGFLFHNPSDEGYTAFHKRLIKFKEAYESGSLLKGLLSL